MRKPSFWASLLVLVVAAVNAHGQSYTIKLKFDADPGQSVVIRDSGKETGSMKFIDLQGKLLHEEKPSASETVYTETVLEKGDPYPTKYKRTYETATETKDEEKAKPLSYQGRTVVFEQKGGKFRVGVVGKPPLETKDQEKLTERANQRSEQTLLLMHLVSEGGGQGRRLLED